MIRQPYSARFLAWCGTLAFALLLLLPPAGAAEVMPPAPPGFFNDFATVTRPGTAERLNRQLEQFEREHSSQIVVAVFARMQTDSSLEDYVHRMFQAWKIGQKGKNNGVLLAIFVQDRKMRIEVGYGLEGAIPDATAKRIISEQIAPGFKSGNFDAGLSAGVTALMQAARGEYQGVGGTAADSGRGSTRGGRFGSLPILLFLGFAVLLSLAAAQRRAFGGTVYGRRSRSGWGGVPGGWTSGGNGWSGGGGGGGFSGGGGSSGGGGASGSW